MGNSALHKLKTVREIAIFHTINRHINSAFLFANLRNQTVHSSKITNNNEETKRKKPRKSIKAQSSEEISSTH